MTNSLEDKLKGAEANRQAAMVGDGLLLQALSKGATYAELAEAYGCSLSTIKTKIYRARRRAGISIRPYAKPTSGGEA